MAGGRLSSGIAGFKEAPDRLFLIHSVNLRPATVRHAVQPAFMQESLDGQATVDLPHLGSTA
jgi:hypothetical protein